MPQSKTDLKYVENKLKIPQLKSRTKMPKTANLKSNCRKMTSGNFKFRCKYHKKKVKVRMQKTEISKIKCRAKIPKADIILKLHMPYL